MKHEHLRHTTSTTNTRTETAILLESLTAMSTSMSR